MKISKLIEDLLTAASNDEIDSLDIRFQKGDRVIEIVTGKVVDDEEPPKIMQ